jgi:hypothetical protein
MTKKYYNVHDIIKFNIEINSPFEKLFGNTELQYRSFEVNSVDSIDFSIYIGHFNPDTQDCHILDDNYYIKSNYLYVKNDSYKLAKWHLELSGIDGSSLNVKVDGNPFAYMFFSGYIIDFLIHYMLNKKGYTIIHSSGVSTNDKCVLFSARGGGGKTTISLNLVDAGYKFMGDNFIVLNSGSAFSFCSPLNIFNYNLTGLVKKNLSLKENILLTIKNIIYKFTFGYVKLFLKIHPDTILAGGLTKVATINALFLIIPTNQNTFTLKIIEEKALIKHLVWNQQLEFSYFIKYLLAYSYIFPNSDFSLHWNNYEKNLSLNLESVPKYVINVPLKYDSEAINHILEIVKNEI